MINYILQGFGFTGWRDFINSSFGHIFSVNFIAVDVVISALVGLIHFLFGFNHLFLAAYVVLIFFEWITGVLASFKRATRESQIWAYATEDTHLLGADICAAHFFGKYQLPSVRRF